MQVTATRGRGTAPAGHQVRHIVFRNLNRLSELARGALELPEATPEQLTHLHRILERESCRHLERAPFGRHKKRDRKSTRLNSSHTVISYAVFCLKKKT